MTALERILAALEHAQGAVSGRAVQREIEEAAELARDLVQQDRETARLQAPAFLPTQRQTEQEPGR